jgi:hypothetical protein
MLPILRYPEEGADEVNPARSPIRCAIYIRKASEEKVSSNPSILLHAQREACEACVLSRRHEGWQLNTMTAVSLAAIWRDQVSEGCSMT